MFRERVLASAVPWSQRVKNSKFLSFVWALAFKDALSFWGKSLPRSSSYLPLSEQSAASRRPLRSSPKGLPRIQSGRLRLGGLASHGWHCTRPWGQDLHQVLCPEATGAASPVPRKSQLRQRKGCRRAAPGRLGRLRDQRGVYVYVYVCVWGADVFCRLFPLRRCVCRGCDVSYIEEKYSFRET